MFIFLLNAKRAFEACSHFSSDEKGSALAGFLSYEKFVLKCWQKTRDVVASKAERVALK